MHVDQADAVAQRQVDQLLPPPPTQWHQERNLEATRPSEHFPLQETDSSSPSTIYTGGRSSIDQTTLVGPVPRRVYQWPPPSPSLRPKSTLEALGQSEHLSCQDAKRDDPSMISTGAKPSGSRTTDLEGNPELLSLGVPLKALGKVPQTSGPSLPDHGSIHTVTECLSGAQKTDSMDVDSQGPSWRSSAPNPYFREMQTARNTHQHGWTVTGHGTGPITETITSRAPVSNQQGSHSAFNIPQPQASYQLPCFFGGCDLLFTTRAQCILHLETHFPKRFQCFVCGRRFFTEPATTAHFRQYAGGPRTDYGAAAYGSMLCYIPDDVTCQRAAGALELVKVGGVLNFCTRGPYWKEPQYQNQLRTPVPDDFLD
ncbi:hypothetical protein NLI96_g5367 [Meripilus lineatus]|uniref:C2H2-type domain-containing protein n=1 Tax=Meripilus lineatus TaxID=2056292 RepID=A0AAD5V348_9APHY|nr:hypothetical protein NLI96_g5367 [Physisporinus lineatus]